MKKLFFTGLVLFLLRPALAQEVIVMTGLSIHSHNKLKSAQANFDFGVDLKSTQSFPPFLQYGLAMRFPLGQSRATLGGLFYSTSTAARSTYEDYSGRLDVDQRLRCLGLGFTFLYTLNESGKSKFNLYTSTGVEISTLKMDINLRLNDNSENVSNTYRAFSPMVEAGFEYQYHWSKKFFVQSILALHISQEAILNSTTGGSEYENVNWTGGKILIGIGRKF